MKAAVIFQGSDRVQLVEMPDPLAKGNDEVMIYVKAVAIKHFDRSKAGGNHYSSKEISTATIVGSDGVGTLPDGTKVYAVGSGMAAEKAIVDKQRMVLLPDGLDFVTAAALPNAVIGSAMGLMFKAKMTKGDVVLINGATGFTGRIAIQIAKHYGAGKVIVTGRNENSLEELQSLGADEIVSLRMSDDDVVQHIQKIHHDNAIDIVIDYLWGHSAELILRAIKGNGSFTKKTRFVSIGSVTGDLIQLSAATLRSVDVELSGSGLGSWSKAQVNALFSEIMPEMFLLAAKGKIKIQTVTHRLDSVEDLWQMNVNDGKRLVITM